jgi:hypothetical protein
VAKKREWDWYQEGCTGSDPVDALWAIVERLEALVGIGDALEEVGDLWANTLAFGGQPVGGLGIGDVEPGPATRGAWMCDTNEQGIRCVLMKGHGGRCIPEPPKYCQCAKPDCDVGEVCSKCSLSRGESDA